MPIPTTPTPAPEVTATTYWNAPHQQFAKDNAFQWHEEVLHRFGEYTAWVLKWRIDDLEAGRTTRCSTCIPDDYHWAVYGQTDNPDCPDCLGTSFDGGYRALIIRPTSWNEDEESNEESRRGEVVRQGARVQSTSDFRARKGDWALRSDNSRWQVSSVQHDQIHSGFAGTSRTEVTTAYGYQMQREDSDNVIYGNVLSDVQLATLDSSVDHFLSDWSGLEDIPAGGYILEPS